MNYRDRTHQSEWGTYMYAISKGRGRISPTEMHLLVLIPPTTLHIVAQCGQGLQLSFACMGRIPSLLYTSVIAGSGINDEIRCRIVAGDIICYAGSLYT